MLLLLLYLSISIILLLYHPVSISTIHFNKIKQENIIYTPKSIKLLEIIFELDSRMQKERAGSLVHPREKYQTLLKYKDKGRLTVRLPVFCLLQGAAQRLLQVSLVTPVPLTARAALTFLPSLQPGT